MDPKIIENIVRTTIDQLTKKPEPPKDNFDEWFRDRMDKNKFRRLAKQLK